ncbi:hypothetical protein P154DRAFT_572644 [Amniculicola lignicola CBS 123094]|uniref:Uncharacterized protein n=1 Tax=Amniculicola lignicola CBS 123094 TaxID=1392246 RepID=A0A6A5WPL1_9PLEO|nr:hypothetical protein P154DRAFT_572644 [Amniculicola lignicola CBS 123094]
MFTSVFPRVAKPSLIKHSTTLPLIKQSTTLLSTPQPPRTPPPPKPWPFHLPQALQPTRGTTYLAKHIPTSSQDLYTPSLLQRVLYGAAHPSQTSVTAFLKTQPGTTRYAMLHGQADGRDAERKPRSVLQALLFGIPEPDGYSFLREVLGAVGGGLAVRGKGKGSVVTGGDVRGVVKGVGKKDDGEVRGGGDGKGDGGLVMFLGM